MSEGDKIELIEQLRRENALLASFVKRHEHILQSEEIPEADDVKQAKGKKGRGKEEKAMKPLSIEDKLSLALKEIEDLQEDVTQGTNEGEKINLHLRAMITAADALISDTMKEAHDFKRCVIVGEGGSSNVSAEKVIQYFEDHTKTLNARVEKLGVKNTNLMRSAGKLKKQLQQKEDTGEVLHAIDYDQLKIENQQHLERIEQKNQELLRLKITSGNTILVLNQLKKQLSALTEESTWLKAELKAREAVSQKLQQDMITATRQEHAVISVQRGLKQEQHGANEPQPIDYIKVKAKEADLIKARDNYRRKIEIAEARVRRGRTGGRLEGATID